MMVYKCDRCGRVIETTFNGGGNGPFVWDGTMSKDQEYFDLCESCYNSLIHWLDKKKYKSIKNGDCSNCKYSKFADHMWPCNNCTHNCVDHWTDPKKEVSDSQVPVACSTCKHSEKVNGCEYSDICKNHSDWEAKNNGEDM